MQDRLRSKMRELTTGDLNRPIVAVGFNSERFDGRNSGTAPRSQLGYAQSPLVSRGQRGWEVANLPETDMAMQDW